jgi:cysteine desulfurase
VNSNGRVYLDWNATTPLLPEVLNEMMRAFEVVGNPSSVHLDGRAARSLIESARVQVAKLVGAIAQNVFFTGSGTEAANAVLSPSLGAVRLLVSAVEHSCSLAGGQFAPDAVTVLPVDEYGRLDLAALAVELAKPERALLSLQLANNETGVIQPVRDAADLVHAAGGLVHVDAVQAAGKIPIDMSELGADILTLSAHKFGGPKGVGAFLFATDKLRLARSLVRGGGQERGQRAGTENVTGIVGFGQAAKIAGERMAQMQDVRAMRDRMEQGIMHYATQAVIFGRGAERLPNTTCFALHGMVAETALIGFDMDGVSVSSGSACSSGKVKKSHVLEAMGVLDELAMGAIRVSIGFTTSDADIDLFLKALDKRINSLVTPIPTFPLAGGRSLSCASSPSP